MRATLPVNNLLMRVQRAGEYVIVTTRGGEGGREMMIRSEHFGKTGLTLTLTIRDVWSHGPGRLVG